MQNIIIDENHTLRRTNWQDFVEHSKGSKQSNFCILTLSYNNLQNTQSIIDCLSNESGYSKIDLLIVDNSSEQCYSHLDFHMCNIIYIRPNQNLGSAGGYGLGMEYIIGQGYEYFCMIEDDIALVDDETFTETYLACKENRIIFINACANAGGSHSRYVQYACYPVDFIKKIGIIDARYFFRSEDLERKIRIENGIEQYNYDKLILNKDHYHPYLKKINGSASRSYFSIRNQLLMFSKHLSLAVSKILVVLYFYIWNSLVRSALFSQYQYVSAWYYAIIDFIFGYDVFDNKIRLSQLSVSYSLGSGSLETTFSDFKSTEGAKMILFGSQMFSSVDCEKLSYLSKSFYFIFNYGIVIGGWATVLLPFFLVSPKIISIDEFVLGTDKFYYSIYLNKFYLLKFFIVCIIGVIAFLIYIPIIFIILLKVFAFKLFFKLFTGTRG